MLLDCSLLNFTPFDPLVAKWPMYLTHIILDSILNKRSMLSQNLHEPQAHACYKRPGHFKRGHGEGLSSLYWQIRK